MGGGAERAKRGQGRGRERGVKRGMGEESNRQTRGRWEGRTRKEGPGGKDGDMKENKSRTLYTPYY